MTRLRLASGLHCLGLRLLGSLLAGTLAFAQNAAAETADPIPTDPIAAEVLAVESQGSAAAKPAERTTPFISSEIQARFGGGTAEELAWWANSGYRSEIERIWFESREGQAGRATKTRIRALQLGVPNLEAPAIALIASPAEGDELGSAMLAARLAPNLPLVQIAEARAYWDVGEYSAAFSSAWRGLAAIPTHLEGGLWVVGSLLLIIGVVLTVGSMAFIAVVGASVLHHAMHDLGDWVSSEMPNFARAAMVATIIILPLALGEGAMGLALGLLAMGFIYAESRMRVAMGLAAALIMLGAYPIMHLAGVALSAFEGDRVALSVYSTVQGMESPRDVEVLERASSEDPLAAHALAARARRMGHHALAFERYSALLEKRPRDVVVLTNLGNLHFGAGETDNAIESYKLAAQAEDSATVMFNLSQAFARAFRMEEFENAMQQAQEFDAERVAMLSSIRRPDFVADLPIPTSVIRDRLLREAEGDSLGSDWVGRIAPGYLGTSYASMGCAFAFVALIGVMLGGRFEHSSRCGRCGRRICTRCDGTVWSSEICDPCHHLFNRPEKTDPALRDTRIAQLRARERRVDRYETLAAVLIPGVGGVLAKRPDLGIVGVLLFAFAVASIVWHRGVVPDPLAVGAAGSLALLMGAVVASLAYALVVLTSLMIRRSS